MATNESTYFPSNISSISFRPDLAVTRQNWFNVTCMTLVFVFIIDKNTLQPQHVNIPLSFCPRCVNAQFRKGGMHTPLVVYRPSHHTSEQDPCCGMQLIYHTVDASVWICHAVRHLQIAVIIFNNISFISLCSLTGLQMRGEKVVEFLKVVKVLLYLTWFAVCVATGKKAEHWGNVEHCFTNLITYLQSTWIHPGDLGWHSMTFHYADFSQFDQWKHHSILIFLWVCVNNTQFMR